MSVDVFDFLTSGKDRLAILMLCHMAEVGREASVEVLDAAIDVYAARAHAAGRVHELADLDTRRRVCGQMVLFGVLEEVRNRRGDVCGWRFTADGVNFIRGADMEAPPWLREAQR